MPRTTEKPNIGHRNQEMAHRLAAAVAEEPGCSPSSAIQAAGLFALAAALKDMAAALREVIVAAKQEDQRNRPAA